MKPASEGPVTVLVFKDNLVARTFQVSLGWITRLGVLLSLVTLIALLTSLVAIKYYRAARGADPVRVKELEQELADLRIPHPAATNAQKDAQTESASVVPAPIPTVTVTSTPATLATGTGALFTGLPPETRTFTGNVPISIRATRFSWVGSGNSRALRLRFTIQYVLDRGSQQGRIVLLARGPETLLAHPVGIFRKSGDSSLIDPDRGEFFSVSRMREVKAEFGPVTSTEALQEVEALLFNAQGQLLVRERLVPEQVSPTPTRSKPVSQPVAPAQPPAQSPANEAEGGAE